MERYDNEISHTVHIQLGFDQADTASCACEAVWEGRAALHAALDHQLTHLGIRKARALARQALADGLRTAEAKKKKKN